MATFTKKLANKIAFSEQLKGVFLEGLAAQIRAGVTPIEVFEHTLESTGDIGLRSLAESSIASISVGRAFSETYEEEGYFTAAESELLAVGEEFNAIPEVVDLLLEGKDETQDFWSVVVWSNMNWIGSFVGIIVVMLLAVRYEAFLSFGLGTRADLFVYGDWLWSNGAWFLLALAAGLVFYVEARKRAGTTFRSNVRWLGFAGPADHSFFIALSKMFAVLFEKGVPQTTALEITQRVFASGGFSKRAIGDALDGSHSGAPFVRSLKSSVFGAELGLQLELLAGRGSLTELASAFESLALILAKKNARLLIKLKMAVAMVTGSAFFWLCIPLVEFGLGGNLIESGV